MLLLFPAQINLLESADRNRFVFGGTAQSKLARDIKEKATKNDRLDF